MVYSACLMSDAQNYTTLSEKLTPQELSEHMNEYFQYLFKPVNERDGQVANVIGDCMLALWPSTEPQVSHKESACRAALQIMEAIDQFNQKYPDKSLPTRLGLHFGQMLMGNVGAEGHFEYAPVGDIVNATQRVEGLNKKLGTMLLASDELVEGTTGVMSRELGRFLLAGKSKPLTIHELLVPGEESSRNHQLYFEVFPEALDLFMQQEWERARDLFQRCLDLDLADGPSLFYWQMSEFYRTSPPEDWEGVIPVTK
jgi:adenylate cyclase